MEVIQLTIKDNKFIEPQVSTEILRRKELRARTVLAYGFLNEKLKPRVIPSSTCNIVCLGKPMLSVWWELGSGSIEVASSQFAGWNDQPCRLTLCIEPGIDPTDMLNNYFQSSMRWLNDNESAKAILAKLFESKAYDEA